MLVKDIPKDDAEKLIAAIADLRPDMSVRIIAEDDALCQLGLVQYMPCSAEVDAADEEIEELVEEVYQMEIDAWNFDDRELKKSEITKRQKELEDRYSKYAIIIGYLEA